MNTMLEKDSKNYHVWSYRQWLVKRFDLFDKPEELAWTDSMIEADVRNNSAWNHRHYLVFGRGEDPSQEIVRRELEYVLILDHELGMAMLTAVQVHQNRSPQSAPEPEPMELLAWRHPCRSPSQIDTQGLCP